MKPNKSSLAVAVLLTLPALNAQAALTSTDGGLGVYASSIDATFSADANLLGTLETAFGETAVINAIIAANGGVVHDTPNAYDNGTHTLSATWDFNYLGLGTANWWGAQAFINYLNSIDYGNSNQWALPASNAVPNYENGSQLGQLFYNELGGIAGYNIPSSSLFSNVQISEYWTGLEANDSSTSSDTSAWWFSTIHGLQYTNDKYYSFYVWPVSPGEVSGVAPVPVPAAAWLFLSGLLGVLGFKRRGNAA